MRCLPFAGSAIRGHLSAPWNRWELCITGHAFFPDHHAYTVDDLNDLAVQCTRCDAAAMVTTEKDQVKLAGLAVSDVMPPLPP